MIDVNADLGITVQDKITGFKGVLNGIVRYISGCHQGLVVPRVKDDGSLIDSQWFDLQRLDHQEGTPRIRLENGDTPGHDRAPPKR